MPTLHRHLMAASIVLVIPIVVAACGSAGT